MPDEPKLAPDTPDQLISLLGVSATRKGCMLIFLFAGIGIIASVVMSIGVALGTAASLAVVAIAVILARSGKPRP